MLLKLEKDVKLIVYRREAVPILILQERFI